VKEGKWGRGGYARQKFRPRKKALILSKLYKFRDVNYQVPNIVCEKLVEKANERGGPDNITVLLAKIDRTIRKSSVINRLMKLIG